MHDLAWGSAAWHGLFHSVSEFNNAGISTFSDSVMSFQWDGASLLPIAIAVIIGSLGFPVLQDALKCGRNPRNWTLHTNITIVGTGLLLAAGFLVILAAESGNAQTLGPMGWSERALNAFFHSAMPRTAGFNSLDVGAFRDETVLFHYALMFIGGGSAGTAGGIKITTVAVLFVILIYQVRGRGEPELQGHTLSYRLASQAVTVIMLALSVIFLAAFYLSVRTPHSLGVILFECISAFATVGLSQGITGQLPGDVELVLVALMFLGRVGTITAATWLAMGAAGRGTPARTDGRDPIIG